MQRSIDTRKIVKCNDDIDDDHGHVQKKNKPTTKKSSGEGGEGDHMNESNRFDQANWLIWPIVTLFI